MKTAIITALLIIGTIVILTSAFISMKKHFEGKPMKKAFRVNLATFAVVLITISIFTISAYAANGDDTKSAEETTTASQTAEEEAETKEDSSKGIGLLAAGLATGLAGIGGGIAVAAGAPSAISATSENPKAFGKAIIFVALGESIALYGVVISILILSKF